MNNEEETLRWANELIQAGRLAQAARERAEAAGRAESAPPEPRPEARENAGAWEDLTEAGPATWIAECTARPCPPTYELAFEVPQPSAGDRFMRDSLGPEGRRQTESGVWEIRLHKSRVAFTDSSDRVAGDWFEGLLGGAQEIDRRDFVSTVQPASQSLDGEFRSRLPEQALPVLGPGGRVTVYDTADAFQADIVVRRRVREVASRWRPVEEIYADIATRVVASRYLDGQRRVYGAFGYFELSKYERQSWLRPVFVISLEHARAGSERVLLESTIAVAATITPGISQAEGLGNWGV